MEMTNPEDPVTRLNQFLVYDELPLWSAPFGLVLLDTIRLRKGMNILDIGSGSGFPLLEIAERAGASCHVYGVDPSGDAIRMITAKIKMKAISNARIINARAGELPFPDGFFQLIVANNGLNNVEDERQALQECYRVADHGAQLVSTVNLPFTLIEFYDVLEEILREMDLEEEIGKMKVHIARKRKPVEYWQRFFEEAGFSVRSVQPDGFRMRFMDGTSFFRHFFIRTAFMEPWRSFLPEDRVESIFTRVENRLNEIAGTRGELEMSVPFVCFDCSKIR
jgi:arsenite methyltransferase